MKEATLAQLFRYPIKSMMGEALESVQITEKGLVGDRAWAVRDEQRGGIRGGRRGIRGVLHRRLHLARGRGLY